MKNTMTSATTINDIGRKLSGSNLTAKQKTLRNWNTSLFLLGFLGIVSGFSGLTIGFLTMSEIFAPVTSLYTTSTILIGASFVLFGLAAHCLDKADAADKAIRRDYCRQHGLVDDGPDAEEGGR